MSKYFPVIRRYAKRIMLFSVLSVLMIAGFLGGLMIGEQVENEKRRQLVIDELATVEEKVKFEIRQVPSYAHDADYREVQQEGVEGVKQKTYAVKFSGDGVELDRQFVSEKITTQPTEQIEIVGKRLPNALTKAKSAQYFTDSKGVVHRETYYDLPMNVVMSACGAGGTYSVREDGAKVDKDGYVIVAANYGNYPRCSVVETSMGPGKVYDIGGFAVRHPHGFDLATDWTKADGI